MATLTAGAIWTITRITSYNVCYTKLLRGWIIDLREWLVAPDMYGNLQLPTGISDIARAWLMHQHPITISATRDAIEVLYNPIFKNQVVKQRVQELLTADDHSYNFV